MKDKFALTPEEQEIEDAFERGEYTPVADLEAEKIKYAAAARYTLEKTRTISIRLTEKSYNKIKASAAREGIPYQTLISSILHKHVKL